MELIGGKVRAVHVGERMRRILVMSGVTRVIEVEEGEDVEVGFGRGVGRKGNGMMRERMKTEEKMRWNTMTLEF